MLCKYVELVGKILEENMHASISINDVSKVYKLYDSPKDRVKEALHPFKKKYGRDFYALKNITFSIEQGESVGIIGKNGAGKSTLLKIITGVLGATSGNVNVNGKISALLELGAGFNPEYTGIENIYLNGTVMGYSRREMDEKLSEILSFADIGDYVYQPVKYYSSGMFVRLAFAVAINVDPEILIVDEALSVGDIRFQQKCYRKIEEFKKTKTVLFVSHDMGVINKYCDRVIWLNDGEIIEQGTPIEISKKYRAFMMNSALYRVDDITAIEIQKSSHEFELNPINSDFDVSGDRDAQIIGIGMFDYDTGAKLDIVMSGQKVKLVIKAITKIALENVIIGFTMKDRLGNIVTQINSFVMDEIIHSVQENTELKYSFEFKMPALRRGVYTISPAIASGTQDQHIQHSWIHDALLIEVVNDQYYDLEGYIYLQSARIENLD